MTIDSVEETRAAPAPQCTRVLVCGGRDWCDILAMMTTMDDLGTKHGPFKLLIHGGAKGADDEAQTWAMHRDLPYMVFRADWDFHGRSAGPIRNQRMIDEGKPDLVVAFPGGKGTADMISRAEKAGIRVVRPA